MLTLLHALLLPVLVTAAPSFQPRDTIDVDVCAGLEDLTPEDGQAFVNASAAYNLRLDPNPVAMVYPKTEAQVATAIACAKKLGKPISIRGGGHSYAAYALGGDGATNFVIDLHYFDQLTFNAADNTATIGAGMRLGDVALGLLEHGRAMPHGTCPTVGIGGHAAHGGYGFYSRLWGLALDRIIDVTAVLPSGKIITASATQNKDIFFALKGAAPSFGVITKYHVTTEPEPKKEQNVRFLLSWDLTATQAADAFIRWQTYLKTAAPELGMAFRMFSGAKPNTLRLDFLGQYLGTLDGFNKQLGSQIKALGPTYSGPEYNNNITEYIDWRGMLEWLGGTPLDTSTGPNVTDTFYAKSLSIRENAPMTRAQILALTNYLTTPSDISWFAMADNWGGTGSKINSVPLSSTSFGSRSNLFGWQLYGFSKDSKPPFPADGIPYVQGMYDAVVNSAEPGWDFGGYVNYVDPRLSSADAHRLYYGSQVTRLETIKKQVDPGNLFTSWPQAFKA